MKILKLQYLNCCLLLLVAASTAKADTFQSVSGKIYRDYSIKQVTHDKAAIFHADGYTWLPHSDLPPHVLRPFAQEIKQQKAAYIRRHAGTIRQQTAKACAAESASQAVVLLLEIKKKHPTHPLIKEVDKLIAQKEKEAAVEEQIRTICSTGTADEQAEKLQALLDENADSGTSITGKITAAIKSRKQSLQASTSVIDDAVTAAAEQEDPEQAIEELQAVLKKYPVYPIAKSQQAYLDRVNNLIAEKEKLLAERKQKIADRMASYAKANPDVQRQLKNWFTRDDSDTFDGYLGEKIREETTELDGIIKKVKSQSLETAAQTLEKVMAKDYAYALNKDQLKQVYAEIQQSLEEERKRERQLAVIAAISWEENGNGPFVIRKSINPSNTWTLAIVPTSNKDTIQKISNLYQTVNEKQKDYLRYDAVGSTLEAFGAKTEATVRLQQALILEMLIPRLGRQFELSGSTCSLKNLNENLLLIAKEKITRDGLEFYNYWYDEYIPGKSGNTWELK